MKILLTSTSFMDTPGPHHDRLQELGLEVDRMRGPLPERICFRLLPDTMV